MELLCFKFIYNPSKLNFIIETKCFTKTCMFYVCKTCCMRLEIACLYHLLHSRKKISSAVKILSIIPVC